MPHGTANAAQKWLQAMQSPTTAQNYKDGITGTTVNPMALAAQADQQYLAGVQDAVNSGRRAAALNAVSPQQWKDAATGKGAQRLASGAQMASAKVQAHFAKWGPIYAQISAQVQAMPKGGVAAAMARVQAVVIALKQAAGKSIA